MSDDLADPLRDATKAAISHMEARIRSHSLKLRGLPLTPPDNPIRVRFALLAGVECDTMKAYIEAVLGTTYPTRNKAVDAWMGRQPGSSRTSYDGAWKRDKDGDVDEEGWETGRYDNKIVEVTLIGSSPEKRDRLRRIADELDVTMTTSSKGILNRLRNWWTR